MNNKEYKEMLEELYKFLREKIITKYTSFISENAKERLYSFDIENNIVITDSSSKMVEYNSETDEIVIWKGFLTEEFINKKKLKNIDFDLLKLKEKISTGSYHILLEELIVFSGDLKIKEIDIIKSLYIQEILKMILINRSDNMTDQVLGESVIELLAHEIGKENDFIVSTFLKREEMLLTAIDLKKELGDKFYKVVFSEKLEKYMDKLKDVKLKNRILEIVDNRNIIESTQNLNEVVDGVSEIKNEVNQVIVEEENGKQIIKFIDENGESTLYDTVEVNEFMKAFEDVKSLKSDLALITKFEIESSLEKLKSNKELENIEEQVIEEIDVHEPQEEIINLDGESPEESTKVTFETNNLENKNVLSEEEFKEISNKFANDQNSLTEEEMEKTNEYIKIKAKKENKKVVLKSSGKFKVFIAIIVVLITVVVGILAGWFLFTIK